MTISIRFVGGPADGRTLTIGNDEPPPRYLIPMPPPAVDFLANPAEPIAIPTADYEPLRENGWPRRTDDGAYLYGHQPAPVTAEAREALELARREAKAAEARRTAELDEAWREIRELRPQFPADWRDLF